MLNKAIYINWLARTVASSSTRKYGDKVVLVACYCCWSAIKNSLCVPNKKRGLLFFVHFCESTGKRDISVQIQALLVLCGHFSQNTGGQKQANCILHVFNVRSSCKQKWLLNFLIHAISFASKKEKKSGGPSWNLVQKPIGLASRLFEMCRAHTGLRQTKLCTSKINRFDSILADFCPIVWKRQKFSQSISSLLSSGPCFCLSTLRMVPMQKKAILDEHQPLLSLNMAKSHCYFLSAL